MPGNVKDLTGKNISAPALLTGPYLNFPETVMAHTYCLLLAERKRKNPDAALAGGIGLSVDVLFYVELIFNTFLINRNNKSDYSQSYY